MSGIGAPRGGHVQSEGVERLLVKTSLATHTVPNVPRPFFEIYLSLTWAKFKMFTKSSHPTLHTLSTSILFRERVVLDPDDVRIWNIKGFGPVSVISRKNLLLGGFLKLLYPHTPVAQKVAVEVVFRRFKGGGVLYHIIWYKKGTLFCRISDESALIRNILLNRRVRAK